jgi:hypothetical protein
LELGIGNALALTEDECTELTLLTLAIDELLTLELVRLEDEALEDDVDEELDWLMGATMLDTVDEALEEVLEVVEGKMAQPRVRRSHRRHSTRRMWSPGT